MKRFILNLRKILSNWLMETGFSCVVCSDLLNSVDPVPLCLDHQKSFLDECQNLSWKKRGDSEHHLENYFHRLLENKITLHRIHIYHNSGWMKSWIKALKDQPNSYSSHQFLEGALKNVRNEFGKHFDSKWPVLIASVPRSDPWKSDLSGLMAQKIKMMALDLKMIPIDLRWKKHSKQALQGGSTRTEGPVVSSFSLNCGTCLSCWVNFFSRGNFGLCEKVLSGKEQDIQLLLLDDIWTTGGTLRLANLLLCKRLKAKKIKVKKAVVLTLCITKDA